MRKSVLKQTIAALVFGPALIAVPTSSYADEVLNFHVLKGDEKIGYEKIEITDTENGRTVKITGKTDVTVLFVDYHYAHERTEKWENNQIVSVEAKTSEDDKTYDFSVSYQDDCYEISGKHVDERKACNGAWPVSMWKEDVTGKTYLYSVINAEPYEVKTKKVGDETLMIENRETPAVHYVMTGDAERKLWYDKNGKLLKTSLKKEGYDIDFIRVDAQ